MNEDMLKAAIIELAELCRWRVYSIRRSDRAIVQARTGIGFPDLTLVRSGRMVCAELKGARGRPTEAQLRWLEALADVPGVESHLWTPPLWRDGTIEGVLRP